MGTVLNVLNNYKIFLNFTSVKYFVIIVNLRSKETVIVLNDNEICFIS